MMMPHGMMGMDQMLGNKPESARTKEALARMVSNRIASGGRVSFNKIPLTLNYFLKFPFT